MVVPMEEVCDHGTSSGIRYLRDYVDAKLVSSVNDLRLIEAFRKASSTCTGEIHVLHSSVHAKYFFRSSSAQ